MLPAILKRLFFVGALGFMSNATADVRTLLIGIDAIPYEVVRKLTDPTLGEQAVFKDLQGPVAVKIACLVT